LAEDQKTLDAVVAKKERDKKAVEQTKIDLLALEKEMRDTRESEGK